MISKEEAQERLKSFYNPNHSADQIARLKNLPPHLSAIGEILIQAGPAWEQLQKDNPRRTRIRWNPNKDIAALTVAERKHLFPTLFPGIASEVELTWNLFDALPYQSGYHRRPFRTSKDTTLESRISWLQRLPFAVRGYEHQSIVWLASWVSHLGYWATDALGYLFASAIGNGTETGNQVFDILISSANGTHETGMMGRHTVRAFLSSTRGDGWEYIERMLLAAQREEGLRQVILEAVDEAHPQ